MQARLDALVQWLPHATDAALICSEPNRLYLTGFSSSAGAVVVTRRQALFLTDGRYIEAAQKQIDGFCCRESSGLYADVAEQLRQMGVKRLFLEAESTTLKQLSVWQKHLNGISVQTDDALDRQLAKQRLVKDAAEAECLRQAQALTDAAFSHILQVLRVGMRERDIALELDGYMRRHGAQDVSFRTIAAVGINTSLPHAQPGDTAVRSGDFITMDFGALLDGYHADMTRTVAVGNPSDEQKKVYAIVLQAQQKALAALQAGVSASAVDGVAREVITRAGYGEYFLHSTGHGVGVEIHEAPHLSQHSRETLVSGCVVTVEPGIYLPAKFGVRIEDVAIVTDNGYRNITASPKELICL